MGRDYSLNEKTDRWLGKATRAEHKVLTNYKKCAYCRAFTLNTRELLFG